jgi:hypothetical protein
MVLMKRLLKSAASAFIALLLIAGLSPLAWAAPAFAADSHEPVSGQQANTVANYCIINPTGGSAKGATTELSETKTPQASFLSEDMTLAVWRSGDSWSLGNGLLSLLCFMEALIVMGNFFYRNRRGSLNLLCSDFMVGALALLVAVFALVGTSITSDFAKGAVIFDRMSPPVIMLFGIQQMLLFGTKKLVLFGSDVEKEGGRFRAKKRYENND